MRFASSDTDTPLRRLDLKRQAGALRLGDAEGSWLDGAEAEIRDELLAVDDRSAVSPELIRRARRTWETRYHFSPARANVMRALDLEGLTVLEVGAGCGAVTRYLGETCANVDALEPNGVRAGVAALRCEDLDSVEVFHGSLEDVPLEPVYDAVVMVGVLEYVGGSAGWDDRVRFLRDAAARVRELLTNSGQIFYHISPGDDVDLPALQRWLWAERGVASLLSEGGAALYGALIAAGAIHDELLTVSPIMVGNTRPPAKPRTSLVEGVAFAPDAPPEVELLSVRRHGSYLFQRSRYKRRGHDEPAKG